MRGSCRWKTCAGAEAGCDLASITAYFAAHSGASWPNISNSVLLRVTCCAVLCVIWRSRAPTVSRSCSCPVSSSRSISLRRWQTDQAQLFGRHDRHWRCNADRTYRDCGVLRRWRCRNQIARWTAARWRDRGERSVWAFLPDGCRRQSALSAGRDRNRRNAVSRDAAADCTPDSRKVASSRWFTARATKKSCYTVKNSRRSRR